MVKQLSEAYREALILAKQFFDRLIYDAAKGIYGTQVPQIPFILNIDKAGNSYVTSKSDRMGFLTLVSYD